MGIRSKSHLGIALSLLAFLFLPSFPSHAIETQSQWDDAFRSMYPNQDPNLEDPGEHPGDEFAWHGHYWIRAYVAMAQTYGETKYLDKAVAMIDHMFYHRDDARFARGELDILANPYYSAPVYYLHHRNEVAPGWRRLWDGKTRDDVVTDGMITQAIMRFVSLVLDTSGFSGYQAKAKEYLSKVEETVSSWNDTFAYDRYGVPGSYWYPQSDGSEGLSSTEVPLNQSAVMAATLLLLDDVKGGIPEYRKKAKAVLDFWRMKRRETSGNTYEWNYYLLNEGHGVEDLGHSHIDMIFFLTAYRYGLMGKEEMERLANTLILKLYKGNASVAGYVDGSGSGNGYYAGFDWIELTPINRKALDIAKEIYDRHYSSPSWARPFLGWAEILRLSSAANRKPNPPRNVRTIDREDP
jgi:hypothetical protein